MSRSYAIYDVFTDEVLSGNPLAVVFGAEDLDTAAMQRVAGEFNLSETVFVRPAEAPGHTANLRIFTPARELPFAGHPTVGAAIAIAEKNGVSGSAIQVLEEQVGSVRAAVSVRAGEASFAEFDLPRLPEAIDFDATREAAAVALNIDPVEIGFENHKIACWTAGVPYVAVPVSGLAVAARVSVHAEAWLALLPGTMAVPAAPYVYCRETVRHDSAFHARMFAPWDGIAEDPATGSAVAAFAGQIMRFDEPVDGPSSFWIEQGMEMGRPSRIRLEIDVKGGRTDAARIGGSAVKVAEGTLSV
ncbi:MAG: PhzF family phenazine biosynthesis protein [Rhizobiaceae bacterium]